MVVTQPGLMKGVIDRHKKKGKPLTRSARAAPLREAIAMTDTRHDVWLVAGPEILGERSDGPVQADVMSVAASLRKDVTIEARARLGDERAAQQAQELLGQSMGQVRQMLQQAGLSGTAASLAIGHDGRVLDVRATIPQAELATLLGFFSMF
jgi:hypothetical protein